MYRLYLKTECVRKSNYVLVFNYCSSVLWQLRKCIHTFIPVHSILCTVQTNWHLTDPNRNPNLIIGPVNQIQNFKIRDFGLVNWTPNFLIQILVRFTEHRFVQNKILIRLTINRSLKNYYFGLKERYCQKHCNIDLSWGHYAKQTQVNTCFRINFCI